MLWLKCTHCAVMFEASPPAQCQRCGQMLAETARAKPKDHVVRFLTSAAVWIFMLVALAVWVWFLATKEGGNPFTWK